ncbi:MAG: hypothetical protein ABFS35_14715 [Bacteroidota bacterium]
MKYLIIGFILIAGGAFFFFRKSLQGNKKESFDIDFGQMKFSETKRNCSI